MTIRLLCPTCYRSGRSVRLVVTYDALQRQRERCPVCDGVATPRAIPADQVARVTAQPPIPLGAPPTDRQLLPGALAGTCVVCHLPLRYRGRGRPTKYCEAHQPASTSHARRRRADATSPSTPSLAPMEAQS